MKIKNLKYILGFIFLCLAFLDGIAFGDSCSSHPYNGSVSPLPGNDASTGNCWSSETNQNSDFWYNNNLALNVEPVFQHWLDINGYWHLESGCSSYEVSRIQTLMQNIGGNCSVCIDGKAGKQTRNRINNCMDELCNSSNSEAPTNANGGCDEGTLSELRTVGELSYQCCRLADQFSSIRITKESRNGPLYLMISSDISNASEVCHADNLDKVTATTASGDTLRLGRTNTDSTNTTCKQKIDVEAFTGDITITVAAGFFEARDEDDNVYAESPAGGPETFHWAVSITGPEMQQVSWTGNNLEVRVAYQIDGVSSSSATFNCSGDKFEIAGGTLTNAAGPFGGACRLYITTDSNEVRVNVKSGVVVGGGAESDPGSQTFTKPQVCETPVVGNSGCTDIYGPSYTASGDCCITQCSTPQNTGGHCNTGYIESGNCCVENSCQYPPLTGNDCSNQFSGRGVYSGAIECCVDSGSCVNPPSSTGQCNGNLVLDQAGQCCITCATPADGAGNCQSGYTVQGSCCFPDDRCGEDQINQGGQCKPCEEGKKPNENHTRCICDPDKKCCGVQLNNVVPFIGDCIEMNTESSRDTTTNVTSVTAFPILMQGLMKILMSVIMIFSFLMIIVAGLMIVSGAFGGNGFATGKKIIKNVIISLILLGCSGLILSLINPSFFGG